MRPRVVLRGHLDDLGSRLASAANGLGGEALRRTEPSDKPGLTAKTYPPWIRLVSRLSAVARLTRPGARPRLRLRSCYPPHHQRRGIAVFRLFHRGGDLEPHQEPPWLSRFGG